MALVSLSLGEWQPAAKYSAHTSEAAITARRSFNESTQRQGVRGAGSVPFRCLRSFYALDPECANQLIGRPLPQAGL